MCPFNNLFGVILGQNLKIDKWRIYTVRRKTLSVHIYQLSNMYNSHLLYNGDYFINSQWEIHGLASSWTGPNACHKGALCDISELMHPNISCIYNMRDLQSNTADPFVSTLLISWCFGRNLNSVSTIASQAIIVKLIASKIKQSLRKSKGKPQEAKYSGM